MLKISQLFIFSFVFINFCSAQVKIGTDNTAPHSSAQLEVQSTTKGLLLPRTTPTNISTPAEGLMVYNNATKATQVFDGTNWNSLSTGSSDLYGKFPNSRSFAGSFSSTNAVSTFSFTVPSGITKMWVEAWSGGSRGNVLPANFSNTSGTPIGTTSNIGGNGGDFVSYILNVTPGETFNLTVGNQGDWTTTNFTTINYSSSSHVVFVSKGRNSASYNGSETEMPGLIKFIAGEKGIISELNFTQISATQTLVILSGGDGGGSYPYQKGGKSAQAGYDLSTGNVYFYNKTFGTDGQSPGGGGGSAYSLTSRAGYGAAGLVILHW